MNLVNPSDSLERQNEKLIKIAEALMRRVEYDGSGASDSYAHFERSALLEKMVHQRTVDFERTLDLLHESNAQLAKAHRDTETARRNLADAIETVRDGFALFDPDDVLVMCNTRFCQSFRDTVPRMSPGIPFRDYVHMVGRSRHLCLPAGETPESWASRRIRRHRDRHVMFNVEMSGDRWLQVAEHRTANGGTVVLQTDVTDIIRLERQERNRLLDTQARMIRATLDHLDQGVCLFDQNACLVAWNEKIGSMLGIPALHWRLGVSFTSLLSHTVDKLEIDGSMSLADFLAWAAATEDRAPISFEVRRNELETLRIFGQTMPEIGFVMSCTDMTAERESARQLALMNEELEQRVMERTLELEDALSAAERANASKSRFVAAASHDLLQPLTAAKLFVSSLTERTITPDMADVLSKTENALISAEQIIDALLDISKLDSDGLKFDIRAVALSEILSTLRDEMEVLAEQKGLSLTIVDTALMVESDPGYLRRVIQNLMANAIRYTETGRVLVGVRREGKSARIEIWDTGPGIAEEDQSAIFEEFHRLDRSAGVADGLGLGLAIVDRACARLGHPLELSSTPGLGSCFKVSVPIARPSDKSVKEDVRSLLPLRLDGPGLIVLSVENEEYLRRALCLQLESWGVQVLEAGSGEEALDLLGDLGIEPDALLLDQQLGAGMSGTEFYQTLTARIGPIPAAIASADRSPELREECSKLGLELMLKPIDKQKLARFLSKASQQP